jgi:hypothetical protein
MIKNEITYYNDNTTGICGELGRLCISEKINQYEYNFIKNLIKNNKPNKQRYVEFTEHKSWINRQFWWTPVKDDRSTAKVRINYLKAVIKNVKNNA